MIALDAITCTILVIVFFAGICGNVTVCLIFFRARLFCTHKNSLHLSLAIADCFSCCFNAPLGIVSVIKEETLPDRSLRCHVLVTVFTIISVVNLMTLASISILRTIVVLRPKKNISKRATYWLIGGIWFSAILLSVTNHCFFHDDYYAMCTSLKNNEPLPNYGKTVGVTLMVISFLIIHCCYFTVLWKRFSDRTMKVKPVIRVLSDPEGCAVPMYQLPVSAKDPVELHSHMTSIHTTLILGAILFISYLPLNVLVFMPQEKVKERDSWFFFAFSVSLIMSMFNPYVYTLRCAAFQREVTSMTPFCSKPHINIEN